MRQDTGRAQMHWGAAKGVRSVSGGSSASQTGHPENSAGMDRPGAPRGARSNSRADSSREGHGGKTPGLPFCFLAWLGSGTDAKFTFGYTGIEALGRSH